MEWAHDLMQWLCFCKEFQRDDDGETTVLTSSNTTTVTRIPREQSVESNTSYKVGYILYTCIRLTTFVLRWCIWLVVCLTILLREEVQLPLCDNIWIIHGVQIGKVLLQLRTEGDNLLLK